MKQLLNSLWALRFIKGIKYPLFIATIVILIFLLGEIDTIKTSSLNSYSSSIESNQYLTCFLFLAFTRYYLNKINFVYLIAQHSSLKEIQINLSMNLLFPALYSLIYLLLFFSVYTISNIEIGLHQFLYFSLKTFVFALFVNSFFATCLRIKNSYSTLFILYFIPIILSLVNLPFEKLWNFNFIKYIPFDSSNLYNLILLCSFSLIFLVVSTYKSKTYFFSHA